MAVPISFWTAFMMEWVTTIEWVDWVAIATIIGFSVLGSFRGLVDQILRIIPSWGSIILMLLSQSIWTSWLDPWVPLNYRSTAALVVAGVSAYPLLLLFVRYLIWRFGGVSLGIFNTIGGAFMGFIQGTFCVILIGFCLWLTPISHEKSFQKSYIAKSIYPFVEKASTQYLWIALKTQPKSWIDRAIAQIGS